MVLGTRRPRSPGEAAGVPEGLLKQWCSKLSRGYLLLCQRRELMGTCTLTACVAHARTPYGKATLTERLISQQGITMSLPSTRL